VFGKLISVQAGDKTIAQYTYAPNNGHLEKLTYGNGDYEEYEYDNLDRLVKAYYNGSTEAAYSITYDANNNIRRLYDGTTTHIYDYDSLGRLIRAWQYDQNGNLKLAVQNSYDSLGRANGTDYAIGEDSFSYNIEYKADSNLVSSIQMPYGLDINYSYDGAGNPTNWHNARSLNWENQRLTSFYKLNGQPFFFSSYSKYRLYVCALLI